MNLPDFLTQQLDGSIHLAGHAIGLQELVHRYNEGYTPDTLAAECGSAPLPLIHKAIAFYLENRAQVDGYMARYPARIKGRQAPDPDAQQLAQLRRRVEAMHRAELAWRPPWLTVADPPSEEVNL